MAKPTILQSLLGRPSQTYSFPEEKVYYSNKRDMVRIAAETSEQQAAMINDNQPRIVKQPNGVRAFDDTQLANRDRDRGVNHADDGGDEDSDYDVFYTPNTSPRISMASTIVAPLKASSPQPSLQPGVPSTKTSFPHANISTTSISSSALDAHSLFSLSNTESTLMTSPVQSESEHVATRVKTVRESPQVAHGHINQEWAKDVRWLVPTTDKATTAIKRQQYAKGEPVVKSQTRSKPHTSVSKTISKMTPSIMTSMTALLEEDELLDTPTPHHPRSNVLISPPRPGRSRVTSNPNHARASMKKSSVSTRNTIHRRRSRSLEHASHISSSSRHTSTSASTSSHTPSPLKNSKYASSSIDPFDRNITSLPIFTAGDLPSQGTPGYTSLVLPRAPVPLSQTSQHPKSILNFKDARYGADVDGKVDLTRSGIAQTTMASVEVVRGLSEASSSPYSTPSRKLIGLFRRSSTSASSSSVPSSTFESRIRSQKEDKKGKGPETEVLDLPLGFTSYRKPPTYVPSGSVLVQVWAVGIDGIDWRLVFGAKNSDAGCLSHSNSLVTAAKPRTSLDTPPITPKRSVSLKSTLGRFGSQRSAPSSPVAKHPSTSPASSCTPAAVIGYIPGRSFIGRVLECGWEVREEVVKKGDWVIGLLDLRKCGALTEFIVVDRRRVHRAPYPRMQQDGLSSLPKTTPNVPTSQSSSILDTEPGPSNSSRSSSSQIPSSQNNGRSLQMPQGPNNARPSPSHALPHMVLPLSLEELALLPGCGIPAYRAVRTFAFAFSDVATEASGSINVKRVARDALDGTRRRRVLVLRGHDGAGALAVQMLVRRGWRVCVHVPFMCLHDEDGLFDGDVDDTRRDEHRMRRVEQRVRAWGGEEVIFDDGEEGDGEGGAVVRIIDRLREDGDIFDAVLDTIGGREVWEAAERLLKAVNVGGKKDKMKHAGLGIKQFTTIAGDFPGRTIPSAGDTFKAGLRSLNLGSRTDGKKLEGKVGYAWVSNVQDVDWEGEDIRDTLREVLRIVTETDIRPWVGDGGRWTDQTNMHRVIPFEKAHELFVSRGKGILTNGGSFVVKVVG